MLAFNDNSSCDECKGMRIVITLALSVPSILLSLIWIAIQKMLKKATKQK